MHLDIPFFWDESWVYGPAVNVMGDIGPTLAPGSFPLEHSRGHPLFFHFLGGAWIMLFGNSLISLHSFALCISVIFVCSIYLLIRDLISKKVALTAVTLLIFQPIFYAQSSMVLPEVLLAFLCFLTLWACYKKKWFYYFLFGSLAIWTKESALAFIFCLLGAFLLSCIKTKSFNIRESLIILSPILSFILFISLNKMAFNWYLYPEHTGMLTLELKPFIGKLKALIMNVFVDQKRYPLSILSIGAALYLLGKNHKIFKNDFLIYLIIPIVGYAVFSAINFYTVRYVLTIFPLTLILFAWLLVEAFGKQKVLFSVLVLGFLVHSVIQLFDRRSVRDIDLSYLDYGPAQLEIIEYMEGNELYDESIQTSFLMATGLTQKYGGYRNTDNQFTKVNQELNSDRNYFIFSRLEPHHHRDNVINHPKSTKLKSVKKGNVEFEIYLLEDSL